MTELTFTDDQKAFISDDDSPRLLLDAPAGAGKTEIVAARVRRLVDRGENPVMLCFTNSAKDTLTRRLHESGLNINALTIHEYAFSLVSDSLVSGVRLGSGDEEARIVCEGLPVKPRTISLLDTLIRSGAPLPDGITSLDLDVYDRWCEYCRSVGLLTFSALIDLASCLPPAAPVAELVVDEAQDISPAMLRFLDTVPAARRVYVGDPDQSIFGWAGVDPNLFQNLRKEGFASMSLTTTHRVPSRLLPVLNAVRSGAPLTASRTGGRVDVLRTSYADAADAVVPRLRAGSMVIGVSRRAVNRVADELAASRPSLPIYRGWESGSPSPAAVRFETVHTAKGAEADDVFLLDLVPSGFWSFMAIDPEYMRRLLYVAASRARSSLALVSISKDGALPSMLGVSDA